MSWTAIAGVMITAISLITGAAYGIGGLSSKVDSMDKRMSVIEVDIKTLLQRSDDRVEDIMTRMERRKSLDDQRPLFHGTK